MHETLPRIPGKNDVMDMDEREGARYELSIWFYDLGVGIFAAIMMVYVNQTRALDVLWAMIFGAALFILGVFLEEETNLVGSYMKRLFPASLRHLGLLHQIDRYMIDLGSGILISGSVLYLQKDYALTIGFGIAAVVSMGIAWLLDKPAGGKAQ